MGRSAFLLVAALSLGSALRAQNPPEYVVRDIAPCLNVRQEPTTDADPIACLDSGTRVQVLDAVPYWRRIRFGAGEEGWAAKAYLELAADTPPPTPAAPLPTDAWLEVHFVDVGQGDAIWIHTPDDGVDGNGRFEGMNIVIDGGPQSSDVKNALFAYLEEKAHHDAVIDALIVSHPHTDHFKGAETISRHFRIRDYYDPGFPSTLVSYGGFLAAIKGTGGDPPRAERVHLGQANFGTLDWGGELTAEVLYGWSSALTGLGSGNTTVNNSSVVLRLAYGNHSFLFMGDAEGKDRADAPAPSRYVERILLASVAPEKLKATVLKVGHHGSETSSTIPFIEAVDPEIVVVQSGRKSFSGTFLPDASTLRRYCCHNPAIRVYRTDQGDEAAGLSEGDAADGDHIVIRTNGTALEITALEGGTPVNIDACLPAC
jgi:beta-lactamase superfamily II metal-dependent hydrolase